MGRSIGWLPMVAILVTSVQAATNADAGWLDADNMFEIDRAEADSQLARYFSFQVANIEQACLNDADSATEFKQRQPVYRQQLLDMLGLDPMPEKTSLEATIVGAAERDGVVVERVHFQSSPGLYVTGNLYRPADATGRLPTVLYVCGHGRVIEDGISYGNKVYYQRHGVWFARHGYVCLLIDTIQLGEIQGVHHGTYRHNRWWWNCRGYTPAGAEAWNCHRAVDYLISRDDVDAERIAVTGRSGGGAYSWWLAATDERIKVAVPVAGITSLWNHVVDGCTEGHCDCMYHVNTQRWDFAKVAALVAPRPLLISNTDKDTIFPLSGVVETHRKVREAYRAFDATENLGLHITEGPHSDTQELRIHAFRWINRFLKQDDSLISIPAEPLFEPAELRVFFELPADEINTTIDEVFVPMARAELPSGESEWREQCRVWKTQLKAKSFNGWTDRSQPAIGAPIHEYSIEAGCWSVYSVVSEHLVELPLFVWLPRGVELNASSVRLTILNDKDWPVFVETAKGAPALPETGVQAWFCPRGVGPTAWTKDATERTHIRRRMMSIGQTLDGVRVWDVRRGIQSLREVCDKDANVRLDATGIMSGVALYASLFEENITELNLEQLPSSHRVGPIFLNVLRTMDVPQAVAMAASNSKVRLGATDEKAAGFAKNVGEILNWSPDQVTVTSTTSTSN